MDIFAKIWPPFLSTQLNFLVKKMIAPLSILTAKSAARTVDWVARDGADAEFRAEMALAPVEIGGLIDILERKIPGTWLGSAARDFGLEGNTQTSDVKNLVQAGILPDGTSIRRPQVKNSALGLIITAPKSISLLLAHPDPRVREAVDGAMHAGSVAAIAVLEASARVRIGTAAKKDLISSTACGLVVAEVIHHTSSTGDPHAHPHLIICATAPCRDGRWRAIDTRIILAAKREAEAAATVAIEKSISKSLGLTAADWSPPINLGSTWHREIKILQRFVPLFSGARDHVAEILEKIGKVSGKTTYAQEIWAWRQHRQDKKLLAEKIEHEIDAALAEGGAASAAIRDFWNQKAGGDLIPVLKRIRFSESPTPDPAPKDILRSRVLDKDFENLIENLRKDRFSIIEAAHFAGSEIDKISARIAREEKSFLGKFLPIIAGQREIRLRDDRAHLAALKKDRKVFQSDLQKIDEKIAKFRSNHAKWEKIESDCLSMLDEQHGWIFSDVSCWLMTRLSLDLTSARIIAADFIDRWTEKSLIKSPIPEKITPIIEAFVAGDDLPPTKIYSVIGTSSKFITKMALKKEQDFAQKITDLTTAQRTRLKIAIDGLDPDQMRAAEKIAMGKKFLPISGVAGAGKSFLMKRVADAARAAGLPVFATARNRKRAQETADDVGADCVFSVSEIEKYLTAAVRQRGGLLIIDEAALIDRADWEKIATLTQDSNFQVVAIGDRYQAQSIDRKGIWHVAHQAAGKHSATLFASRRCQKWHAEHDFLRNGGADFLPIAEKEGRMVPKIAAAAPGWIAQKILDTPGAIAVTATNAEAAEISAAVQKKMQIEGKIRCRYACKIGIGDKIRTRKNERSLFVTNGDEFLVEKIHADGSVRAKSMKNPSKSVTLPPAYLAENVELAYTSTIDSAQGITVRQAIVCVTGAMGRSALYSGSTRGTEAPIYVMTGATTMDEAAAALTATLARDDIAASLREIGEKADFLRESQKNDEPAPAAVTASQRAAKAAPPPPLPLDLPSRLAAIRARDAERKARQRAAVTAPSGQDRAPEMTPQRRF